MKILQEKSIWGRELNYGKNDSGVGNIRRNTGAAKTRRYCCLCQKWEISSLRFQFPAKLHLGIQVISTSSVGSIGCNWIFFYNCPWLPDITHIFISASVKPAFSATSNHWTALLILKVSFSTSFLSFLVYNNFSAFLFTRRGPGQWLSLFATYSTNNILSSIEERECEKECKTVLTGSFFFLSELQSMVVMDSSVFQSLLTKSMFLRTSFLISKYKTIKSLLFQDTEETSL